MASRERRKRIGGFEKSWGYALYTRIWEMQVRICRQLEESLSERSKEDCLKGRKDMVQLGPGSKNTIEHALVVGSARPMR